MNTDEQSIHSNTDTDTKQSLQPKQSEKNSKSQNLNGAQTEASNTYKLTEPVVRTLSGCKICKQEW